MRDGVSIVIPNWNGRELLEKQIPFVIAAKRFEESNVREIIVVDDKSSDDSVDFLKNNFAGDVAIIRHTVNRGFSATVNTGVRTARGEFIVLLNTDAVPEKDFLRAAIPLFRDKDVFAISFHEKGYGPARGSFKDGFVAHEPLVEDTKVQKTFWVSGGSGVFRRSLWMKIGGLDEKLFSPFYWEDVDLSYRAMKRGYKLLWDTNARIFHSHEGTVKKLPPKFTQGVRERNQLLFIWKNITSPNLFRKHLVGLLARIARHPGYIRVFFNALFYIRAVLAARSKEKKEAKISDEAILARFK